MFRMLLQRVTLVGLGFAVVFVFLEVTGRLAFDALPYPLQESIRTVRTYGFAGPPLASFWWQLCEGNLDLGAVNDAGLDDVRVQFGPAIYRVTTHDHGYGDVGFRSSSAEGPWDGVVLGDSFAFCHHIDLEDCWVTHLEAERGLRLANLGVPGTGSVSHLRHLEEFGLELEPELVVWQYWVNDMGDDVDQLRDELVPCPRPEQREPPPSFFSREGWVRSSVSLMLARDIGRELFPSFFFEHEEHEEEEFDEDDFDEEEPEEDVDAEEQELADDETFEDEAFEAADAEEEELEDEEEEESDVYVFETTNGIELFAWRGEGLDVESPHGRDGFDLTTQAITEAAALTRAAGARFLLLIAPSNLQVYAHVLPDEEVLTEEHFHEKRASDRLVAFARERGIETLDLRPAFIEAARAGEVLYPNYDCHWNARGNELAAAQVSAWLEAHPRGATSAR